MKKILFASVAIFCYLSLTGCALTPEAININPQVKTIKKNIGHGKKISISVIDARADQSLGGRASGYGPAANITISGNLAMDIKKSISKGFINYGFIPDSTAKTKLVVRIMSIQYSQRAGFFTAGIRISSSLDATATQSERSYEKVYRSSDNQRVMFTPSSDSDNEHTNASISQVINNLLTDKKLLSFLSKK